MPSESPNEGAFTTYGTNEEVTGSPEYMSPIMDRGLPYLPYRGAQFHGVAPQEVPTVDDQEDIPDGTVVTGIFQPPEDDVNPVPVRIVETAAREYKSFRVWQAFVDNTQVRMVANRKEGQSSVRVRNTSTQGTNRVYIGPDPSVSIYTGYPFAGNDELVLTGEAPIYAIADPATVGNVTLAVLSEFSTAE